MPFRLVLKHLKSFLGANLVPCVEKNSTKEGLSMKVPRSTERNVQQSTCLISHSNGFSTSVFAFWAVFSDRLTVWSLWWSLDKKSFSMYSHMTHQNSKQMVETKQLLEMVQVQTLWSLLNSVHKFQMKASTAVILAQELP